MPRFDMSEFDATTIAEPPTELSKMAAKFDQTVLDSDVSDLEADGSAIFHNAQTNQQMPPQSEFGDLSADLADDALLMARNESVNGGSTASGRWNWTACTERPNLG